MNADLHQQLRSLFDRQCEDVTTSVPEHFDPGRTTTLHRPDRRRPFLAAAAAIALVAGGVAVLAGRTPESPGHLPGPDTSAPDIPTLTSTTVPTADPPSTTSLDDTTLPDTTTPTTGTIPFEGELGTDPLMPEVFPAFAADDPRQSTASASYGSAAGTREAAASALVGRVVDGSLAEWVEISIHDDIDRRDPGNASVPHPLDSPGVETEIDGTTYDVHGNGMAVWSLVLRGEPDIAITGGFISVEGNGTYPANFVRASGGLPVRDIARTAEGGLTFEVGALPDGYEQIVAPTPRLWAGQGVLRDPAGAYTVTTQRFADLLVDTPDLMASSLEQVDVNGVPGWARLVAAGEDGLDATEDLVTWQVAPGTWATVEAEVDALEVARSVVFVDGTTWRSTYDVTPIESRRPPQRLLDLTLSPSELGDSGGLLFLPDGHDVLVFTSGEDVIIDGETGGVLQTFAAPGTRIPGLPAMLPSFSPDGSIYADGSAIWEVESGRQLTDRLWARWVISSDNRWAATTFFQDDFIVVDLHSGEEVWQEAWSEVGSSFGEYWFSDDSSQILMAGESDSGTSAAPRVYDVLTGERTPAPGLTPPVAERVGFAADPARVAELDGPFDACQPVGFHGVEATVRGSKHRMPRCAISPDGSRIAMLDVDAAQVLVWELDEPAP